MDPVKFGTKYWVYPDGRIWKEEHKTTRSDGVTRTWSARWQPTRIRKADIGKGGGYEHVDLDNSTYLVHRVVALCFIPNPDNLSDVNHKNGCRSDNRVENLEWISRSENQKHAYKTLHRQRKGKLTDEQYEEIAYLRNVVGLSLKEIAGSYGIVFQTVSDIAKGNRFALREEDIGHA